MKFYDKVLNSKFNNNTNYKNIGSQYQPITDTKPITDAKPITTNSAPITLKPLSDVEGLQRAYERPNGVYIRNNTMFVAGTRDLHDWYDDFTKIPTNTTYNALRYRNADKALKQNDELNPDSKITSLVGHSLAGAVVLEMQKQYPDRNFKTTTYGAPVASMTTPDNINNKRYRNYQDPVSILDRGATMNVKNQLNVKDYQNLNYISNVKDIATKALNNHGYENFTNNQIDDTTKETYVYRTDE